MTTMEERMKERANSRPDEFTNAWWKDQFSEVVKGYRGLTHACNCVMNDQADQHKAVQELRKVVEVQGQWIDIANAKIGELQEEVVEVKESLKKAREAYSELKAKVS